MFISLYISNASLWLQCVNNWFTLSESLSERGAEKWCLFFGMAKDKDVILSAGHKTFFLKCVSHLSAVGHSIQSGLLL